MPMLRSQATDKPVTVRPVSVKGTTRTTSTTKGTSTQDLEETTADFRAMISILDTSFGPTSGPIYEVIGQAEADSESEQFLRDDKLLVADPDAIVAAAHDRATSTSHSWLVLRNPTTPEAVMTPPRQASGLNPLNLNSPKEGQSQTTAATRQAAQNEPTDIFRRDTRQEDHRVPQNQWATSQALRRALTRRLRLTQSRDAFDATSSASYRMPGPPNLTRAIRTNKVKLARKWAAVISNFQKDVTAYVEEAYFEAVTAEDQEIATLKEDLDRTSIQKATYLANKYGAYQYPEAEEKLTKGKACTFLPPKNPQTAHNTGRLYSEALRSNEREKTYNGRQHPGYTVTRTEPPKPQRLVTHGRSRRNHNTRTVSPRRSSPTPRRTSPRRPSHNTHKTSERHMSGPAQRRGQRASRYPVYPGNPEHGPKKVRAPKTNTRDEIHRHHSTHTAAYGERKRLPQNYRQPLRRDATSRRHTHLLIGSEQVKNFILPKTKIISLNNFNARSISSYLANMDLSDYKRVSIFPGVNAFKNRSEARHFFAEASRFSQNLDHDGLAIYGQLNSDQSHSMAADTNRTLQITVEKNNPRWQFKPTTAFTDSWGKNHNRDGQSLNIEGLDLLHQKVF